MLDGVQWTVTVPLCWTGWRFCHIISFFPSILANQKLPSDHSGAAAGGALWHKSAAYRQWPTNSQSVQVVAAQWAAVA